MLRALVLEGLVHSVAVPVVVGCEDEVAFVVGQHLRVLAKRLVALCE